LISSGNRIDSGRQTPVTFSNDHAACSSGQKFITPGM
jgi:hypothetical protein